MLIPDISHIIYYASYCNVKKINIFVYIMIKNINKFKTKSPLYNIYFNNIYFYSVLNLSKIKS